MSYATDGMAQSTADVKVQRSTFRDPHSYKTTFNSGYLYPVYCREILPGDSLKIDSAFILRMLTPVVPVMDNAFFDIRFFFVPSRICNRTGIDDKSFQRMLGENISSAWANDVDKLPDDCLVKSVNIPAGGSKGTLWDYFGLPHLSNSGSSPSKLVLHHPITALPFYAYQLIWNEWYRNQNLSYPAYYFGNELAMLSPLPVMKLHDVFTDALPSPQKGDDVLINFLTGLAPVIGSGSPHDIGRYIFQGGNGLSSPVPTFEGSLKASGSFESDGLNLGIKNSSEASDITKSNLVANLAAPGISSGSVNQLRTSFALQRQLEKDARGGTRYREKIMSTFGVEVPNGFLDIPEYLGGKRIPINMDSVLQTSATEGNSALGDTGAMSMTTDSGSSVDKSFFEYGYVIGVLCVRTEQSYFQGIDKCWRHISRNDFYSPTFANIGEQPIMKSELYLSNADPDDDVFGYQEAWYEYRHTPNKVTGGLNPDNGDVSLSHWTYANRFESAPLLNHDFNVQSEKNIGDTLVDTTTKTQFIIDLAFDDLISRAMPLYSVPGLVDHF